MNVRKIRPLNNQVLLYPEPNPPASTGGIAFAPAYLEHQENRVFRVVEVGPGKKIKDGTRVPLDVKPGDRITLDQYALGSKIDAGKDEEGRQRWLINGEAVQMVL